MPRVLSRAQTHDWTSENAAHYPKHRAQRGRTGARQQARRPDGCAGALGPHHRGQACARSRERASLTRRNENHFLQHCGETKDQGVCPHRQGQAIPPEPPPQGGLQWRQGREHSRTPAAGSLVFQGICSEETPAALPAALVVCNLSTSV